MLMAEKETSCISEVIFHAHALRKKLEKTEIRFVKITQQSLLKYIDLYLYGDDHRMQYVNVEKSEPHSIATVLDPRFKVAKIFRDHEAHGQAVSKLKKLVVRECQQYKTGKPSISTTNECDQQNPGSSMITASGDYWVESLELFDDSHNNSPSQHTDKLVAGTISPEEIAKEELEAYMADNIQLPTENPLNYWKIKRTFFPNLARVAHRFLAAPLSSVSSERQFKVGKRVITDTRSRLLPQNAEMLIWLNYNVRTVGYSTFAVLKEHREFKNKNKDAEHEYQLAEHLTDIISQSSGSEDSDCLI